MSIKFITGNADKFNEVQKFIPGIEQLTIDLPEIQDIDPHNIIKSKLQEAAKHYQGRFVVEDTSLWFKCLNGLPGPFIKWFEKSLGNDGLYNLVQKMGDNRVTNRALYGYYRDAENIEYFEGAVEGIIVAPQGDLDFGWGPLFQPLGAGKTYGQMSKDEKAVLSPRRIALEKLAAYLENHA